MIKKINKYLIENHPLIWNLKLLWILGIGILVNCIAFINGYYHYQNTSQLLEENISAIFLNNYYGVFYFLFIVIILIIWLYFYIKNNRFKSNYPTSRNYLFKEFLGVFSIISLFLCVPNIFRAGLDMHVANTITDEQFDKDVDLINRVSAFTLQQEYGYDNFSRNLSVPVFDTLVSEQEFLSLYTRNKKQNLQFIDIKEPYFRNEEFNDLLVNKLKGNYPVTKISFNRTFYNYQEGKNNLYENINPSESPEIINPELNVEAAYNIDKTVLYSLYNYSDIKFQVRSKPEFTHQYYDKELIKILETNNRSEIVKLTNSYQQLLDKYKIGYRFKDKNWLDYIPQYPYYFISHELQNSEYYNGNNKFEKDYINAKSLIDIYTHFEIAKYNSNIFDSFQYYILAALIITLHIILFRFSSFKVWLISLVGSGIVVIIGTCLGLFLQVFDLNTYIQFIIPILFYLIFIIVTFRGLKLNKNKIITGVALNWFTVTTLFIGLVVLSFYKEMRLEILYMQGGEKINYYELYDLPEIVIIDKIIELFFYFNPILFIILFYGIIQLYRKWQAMAEE
ncbi:hypothetical protein [Faecalibacter rhinopitheci]|uniref:Uncharacterized protein n=1 Tax=Faecalibacter rhinopitheci TaxID=2779678 RepID=A0A8J7FQM8_9FLAO|nr:hypothetical protein [Faecalibacter rhinopitheci]MBF0597675.1 hypothetical protein [Faecalibacter rhinopitheci]